MRRRYPVALIAALAVATAACSSPTQDMTNDAGMLTDNRVEAGLPANDAAAMPAEPVLPPPPVANATATATADPFVGRWIGVEGLYATIAPGQTAGSYTVEMQYGLDEDDRGTFPATRQGDALVLTRAGETVRLVPGDGEATGMKWLAEETDCLVAIAGSEGYCRS